MKRKMNKEELRQMIINSVKENELNDIFSEEHIQEVMTNILKDYKKEKVSKQMNNEIIPEGQDSDFSYNTVADKFPYEEKIIDGPVEQQNNVEAEIGMERGAAPIEQPSDPTMYQPELPVELQGKESAEIFVFDYNELSVGGENLSNKLFHKMDDPDGRTSMADEWKQNGKTKAKVYAVKFEELGEIDFNYVTGQSSFTERGKEPHVPNEVNTHHENPYASNNEMHIDHISTETDLAKSIESSVDMESMIEKTLLKLLSKGLNSSAMETPVATSPSIPVVQPEAPLGESVEISMTELMSSYEKTATPEDLKESLVDGKELIGYKKINVKGNDIQGYSLDENRYFFPKNPISYNNCYIKA